MSGADARPAATMQRIEWRAGPTLWPELRELIDPQERAVILADAATKARQRTLRSWLLALVAGIAVFLLVPASPESAAAAAPAATRIIQPAGDAGKPVPDPWIAAPAPDDTSTLEQQREDIADAVSTLPMVDRAVWSTQSTLQVFLLDGRGNAFDHICPLVVPSDPLAPPRPPLPPPPGSELPTRFRPCRGSCAGRNAP